MGDVLDTCGGCGALVGEWHYPACIKAGKAKDGDRYQGRKARTEKPRRFVGEDAVSQALAHLGYDEFPAERREARQWLADRMKLMGDAIWQEMERKLKAVVGDE